MLCIAAGHTINAMEIAIVILIVLLLFLPRIRSYVLKQTGVPAGTEPRQAAAMARVRQIKLFYIHLGFYGITALSILLLSLVVNNRQVALIATIVWGMAVALHGFVVFVINSQRIRRWEQRQVKAMLDDDD